MYNVARVSEVQRPKTPPSNPPPRPAPRARARPRDYIVNSNSGQHVCKKQYNKAVTKI